MIKFKRGQSKSWSTKNPTLEEGQPGMEILSGGRGCNLKLGDGSTPWNDLPYINANPIVTLIPSGTNFNTIVDPGLYRIASSPSNYPNGPTSITNTAGCGIIVLHLGAMSGMDPVVLQIAWSEDGGGTGNHRILYRSRYSGAGSNWQSWKDLDVTSLPWSSITGKPTTLSGFGITDGVIKYYKTTFDIREPGLYNVYAAANAPSSYYSWSVLVLKAGTDSSSYLHQIAMRYNNNEMYTILQWKFLESMEQNNYWHIILDFFQSSYYSIQWINFSKQYYIH